MRNVSAFGITRQIVGAVVAIGLLSMTLSPAARADGQVQVAGLRFQAPGFWERADAGASPRVARFVLPRFPGDPEDGELVVLFYGAGKGGSAQEILDRWYEQFTQPDGGPSRDAATVTVRTVHGLKVTSVNLGGTYLGEPGDKRAKPKPDVRLLAAVVEGEGGPWIIRLLGPDATISEARQGFGFLLATLDRAP